MVQIQRTAPSFHRLMLMSMRSVPPFRLTGFHFATLLHHVDPLPRREEVIGLEQLNRYQTGSKYDAED